MRRKTRRHMVRQYNHFVLPNVRVRERSHNPQPVVISFVDPYADTQELPVFNGESSASMPWEREQIARHIGSQYQVVRELGRGGMGIVYLARDIALHRLVAIKVLRREFATSDEDRERF